MKKILNQEKKENLKARRKKRILKKKWKTEENLKAWRKKRKLNEKQENREKKLY